MSYLFVSESFVLKLSSVCSLDSFGACQRVLLLKSSWSTSFHMIVCGQRTAFFEQTFYILLDKKISTCHPAAIHFHQRIMSKLHF